MSKYNLKHYTNLTPLKFFAKINRYTSVEPNRCLSISNGLAKRIVIVNKKKPQAVPDECPCIFAGAFPLCLIN